ncbi:MAG: hypothetical protein IPJ79_08215 [Bacteroidetes bacterium]|nr:hypothetical protein [Bacteroidota bacterium]
MITSGYNIIRVNDNAQIDSSFGVNGLTPTISAIGCLAVQPDGKILGGGGVGAGNYDFSVERFNDDGTIDSTFDNDGLQTRSFSSGPDGAEEIKIQVDGKILAGGFSNMVWGGLVDYGLMRLNNDGSFDSSFGNNGIVVTDFNL